MKQKLTQARNQLIENIKNVYQDKYQLSFLTGSLSRDHSDNLSDIDVWLVADEEKINNLIKQRFDHYNQVGKIAHFCEPPHHSPLNGMASTVIYNTEGILTEVDYSLCSNKVAKFIKNAKVLFGEVNIPEGFPENNTEKRELPETYRLDFFLMLLFIAVKKTHRNDRKYLEMFSGVYHKLKTEYGYSDLSEVENNYDFETLYKYMQAVEGEVTEKQKEFLKDIERFINIVIK
jgi:predicted nucleotidyltransferase